MNEESVLNQKKHSNKGNEAPTGSLNIQNRKHSQVKEPIPFPKKSFDKAPNARHEETVQQ